MCADILHNNVKVFYLPFHFMQKRHTDNVFSNTRQYVPLSPSFTSEEFVLTIIEVYKHQNKSVSSLLKHLPVYSILVILRMPNMQH